MLLADWQIDDYVKDPDSGFQIRDYIPEFVAKETTFIGGEDREDRVRRFPSSGLSPHGYDCRLHNVFERRNQRLRVTKSNYFVMQPGETVLASTVEYFVLPPWIAGEVWGKSTYARNFIHLITTPLEAGWEGHVTLEIANHNPNPVNLYIGAGICQVRFHKCAPARKPYGCRGDGGKYQRQGHAVPAR